MTGPVTSLSWWQEAGSMERVDVAVLGNGVEALAAAAAAASGGVRVILVADDGVPRNSETLYGVRAGELAAMGLGDEIADRRHDVLRVEGSAPIALAEGMELLVVAGSTLDDAVATQAKKAGAELRTRAEVVHADLDPEGWRLQLSAGEPIRAPVLIVADGARSRTLETLGIAQAQRFSASGAEIVTFLCATWEVGVKTADAHRDWRIVGSPGPLGRVEILPGRKMITAAFGPIWRGIAVPDSGWPSPHGKTVDVHLETARRLIGVDSEPDALDVEEWRLDALPTPATFDGGVVIGAAAGHRLHEPLTSGGHGMASGRVAGRAAARAVLAKDWTAANLKAELSDEYSELTQSVGAQIAHSAGSAPARWRA